MSAEALLLQPAHGDRAADAVRRRDCSVLALAEAAAARLQATDGVVNAFTQRTLQRAFGRAAALDARLAAGDTTAQALPLAGVPYAVKNLFDIEGVVTLAGSKIERDRASRPAARRGAGAAPGRRRRRAAGRAEHGRVRLRLHHRERTKARHATRTTPRAWPVARRADRPPRWPPARCR
jgi:hypothetical protein